MAKAREELIVGTVWGTPPASILVVLIELRGAHDIEWSDTHQSIGDDGSRIGRTEVARANEGIYLIDKSLPILSYT